MHGYNHEDCRCVVASILHQTLQLVSHQIWEWSVSRGVDYELANFETLQNSTGIAPT